jgi:formylglycine-generating enzyme
MPMKRTRMDRKTPWTSSKAMMTKEPSMNARRQRIVIIGLAVIAGMALLAIALFGPIRPSDRAADNRGTIGPTRPQSQSPAPLPEIIPSPKLAVERDAALPGPAPDGMVWIPGGTFWMGADDTSMADATPVHEVTVSGFWMDRTEITNRQFASFVKQTAYITVAERPTDPKEFPDAPPEKLVPGSIVFTPPVGRISLDDPLVWWRYVPGASWRHPEGPGSSIQGKDDHPVVQICWYDAVAFAQWAGKRLPTEAEWERAARGGRQRARYVWGNELRPGGKCQANIWEGHFPDENSSDDGFARTAPVATFPPNDFGLHDIAGNVWEWCSDWYRPNYDNLAQRDPTGPPSSYDPSEPGVPKRVQRGGSFLCSDQYCTRYLPGARGKGAPDSAASHVGFRCVLSAKRAD